MPEPGTRPQGGSDADHPSGRKAAVTTVRKFLEILPAHCLMVAAAIAAKFGFPPPERGVRIAVCLPRGCGHWAQRLGKNPGDLEPRLYRRSVQGRFLERLQSISDPVHRHPDTICSVDRAAQHAHV